MELTDAIYKRRSYRNFLEKEIDENVLNEILKAGMHAPVASGRYDNLEFVVLKGEELDSFQQELKDTIKSDPTYNCETLIMIYHKGTNVDLANLDGGCVGQNLMLKAIDLGIGSVMIYCIKRFFNEHKELEKYLKIDNEYNFIVSIALGYSDFKDFRDVSHKIIVK